MFIIQSVWEELSKIENSYKNIREENALERGDVTGHKIAYQSILVGRVNKLAELDESPEVERERFECAFLYSMLQNGWTVGDMECFAKLNELIDGIQDPKLNQLGQDLITELAGTKIETVEQRMDFLNKCGGFARACGISQEAEELQPIINSLLTAKLNFAEYIDDKEFLKHFDKEGKFNPHRLIEKGRPIAEYETLYKSSMRHAQISDDEKQRIRDRKDYVIKEKTDKELEQFTKTEGHKAHGLNKSTRNAIKEVYGDELYDDIDEMSKGTDEERTVSIHHALGNKYLRKGEEVLELDFAGSGYKETRREYRGQHGKMFTDGTRSTSASIEAEFGPLVKKGKTTYKYLRSKKTEIEVKGKKMEKIRYTIAGPSPDAGGLFNLGEYSIENTRAYGKQFTKEFLKGIFEDWKATNAKPHDVHINITGHSRGAVSAGETARLVNNWMKSYVKKNEGTETYTKKVKFGMFLRDPVPGAITSWRLGSQDFRKIPNADVTVFCSVAQEHADIAFPLQNIRGAKRVIIGATGHDMDLGNIDFSQKVHSDDGLTHKEGFYDAETGEIFRGSGVSEMPEGVYISDDKFNMIRITSYSQVGKLIDSIYSGKSKQKGRVETIHDMVRNWFVDNNLQMGFANEDDYEAAHAKNEELVEKLIATTNSRISPFREVVKALKLAKYRGAKPEELVALQQDVIRIGKKYMAKTKIPCKGDSQYRMDLVSDIVTFTMREKNYITRKNNLDNGRDVEGRALDEKIRAHKERLEKKPGALERRIEKEEKRLAKDKSALSIIKQTKKFCEDAEKILNETRKNKTPSDTYNLFISAIREGKDLSENISVNQFKKFLNKLYHTSRYYKEWHMGAESDDGRIRLTYSEGFEDMAKEAYGAFHKATKFIADKNQGITDIINNRSAKLDGLRQRLPEQPEMNNQNEVNNQNEANVQNQAQKQEVHHGPQV